MVFLRYLLIIGLSVCVCFTGYSVFQSFKTDDSQEDNYSDFATFDDAPPLFDGTPTETSSTDLVGSSPVISFPTGNDSNKIPQNPAISELEKPSVFTTGTPIIAENVESDETEETLSDLDLTFGNSFIQNIPEIGGFGYSKTFTEAFEESAALEKQFKLAEALRLLSLHLLYAENELTEEQDKQSRDKLEELAAKVIFTANKHLALPAKTYMPDQTLVSIAKEHEISVAFLKSINQFDDENLPTPGDSLKVIQGPLSVVLDTKRNQAILYADKLFVQRYDLDSANLDPSIDSVQVLNREADSEEIRYTLNDKLALSSSTNEKSDQPQLLFSTEALNQFASLVGDQINGQLIIPEPEKIVETKPETQEIPNKIKVTVKPEAPAKTPVDSLQMEVFSPSKSVPLGQTVLYGIRVTNLSDKPVEDVNVVAFFSEGLEPKVLEGAKGKVSLGQAAFQSIHLAPGESIELTIKAESIKAGEFVFRPEVESQTLATKFVSELFLKVRGSAPSPETANSNKSILR